ncbi:MAG TPA: peptidoglycan-binding domain-containing protein [Kribbella sp.]|uniref:peptidoglycan-binding domain-containing protein n=1 Tax=Kribbella sp. TaxID=1871183 RepID=UPI002D7922DE|nr:peptidoglycan-binding domain-containing protein [Kribbella sp.]HET6297292.1 peptidoglycan-binding domain-containing protein [Kribbella sp.]
MELRSKPFRIAVAVGWAAVLAVGSTLVATSSEAVPTVRQQSTTGAAAASVSAKAAAAAVLEACERVQLVGVRNGWAIPVPMTWESNAGWKCNLKYGDLPYRFPQYPGGTPWLAIRQLQTNLNYCYGAKLTVDGKFGSKTRTAVQNVQRRHKITVDGVYGPQTRSAMNWRLYNPAKKIWSSACYSPI